MSASWCLLSTCSLQGVMIASDPISGGPDIFPYVQLEQV